MVEDCKIYIRQERPEDYSEIRSLVKEAFAMAEHSDGDEHNLIDRIRMSDEYIPELSLVAVMDDAVVGHIMFSKILIGNYCCPIKIGEGTKVWLNCRFEAVELAYLFSKPPQSNSEGCGGSPEASSRRISQSFSGLLNKL